MTTYSIVEMEQGSQEWLSWRRGKIGASDAPVIMGVSKHKTPLQLWEEHIFGKTQETNFAMESGKDAEPIARACFNVDNSVFFEPVCLQSKEHPWRIASLDGWTKERVNGLPRILEIKKASAEDHQTAFNGQVPKHYYPQLQHQMDLEGETHAIYLSWYHRSGIKVIVEKNEDYCKELLRKEEEFYGMLNSFQAPEPTERDVVELNDDSKIILARTYRTVSDKIEELQKEKDAIKEALIKSCSHPRVNVGGIKLRQDLVRGRVDYEKIEVLKTIDLNKYRKPSSVVWRVYL